MAEARVKRSMPSLIGGIFSAVVAFVLWKPGWSALTWDDFTRVDQAQQWGAHPFLALRRAHRRPRP